MRVFWAILLGGLTAGSLDILSAFATFVPHGATVPGILQFIASGLIGKAAFTGGTATVALGLIVHFGLTTAMAAVFVVFTTKVPLALARPWLFGCGFGVLAYVAMNFLIVPHSAVAGWKLPEGWGIVSGLLAHCMFVGAPIAHISKHFLANGER